MKGYRIVVGIVAVGLLLALTMGPGLAQESQGRAEPQGAYSIDAAVSSTITYQGMLLEDGSPVNGSRDMGFRLYEGMDCTLPELAEMPLADVAVSDGVFSAHIPVNYAHFNGRGVWLEVEVEGTVIGCHEVLPVPYALSLRPGALVIGQLPGEDVLFVRNTSTVGASYGVYGMSDSASGMGVMGAASAASGQTFGLYGLSNSASGAGVLARGVESGADLILGGNSSSQDNGTLYSDPAYPSSDIVILTNDTLRVDLDNDGDGEDADFEIRDKDDALVFDVDESGDVTYGGAGLVAFPRPAYDSGWQAFDPSECRALDHNLGGNADNYVVDMQFRKTSGTPLGVHISGYGLDVQEGGAPRGGWWQELTNTSITVCRGGVGDTVAPEIRIRIWMYP
jgi:hypothetical protein